MMDADVSMENLKDAVIIRGEIEDVSSDRAWAVLFRGFERVALREGRCIDRYLFSGYDAKSLAYPVVAVLK